jgi:hypothetical protein
MLDVRWELAEGWSEDDGLDGGVLLDQRSFRSLVRRPSSLVLLLSIPVGVIRRCVLLLLRCGRAVGRVTHRRHRSWRLAGHARAARESWTGEGSVGIRSSSSNVVLLELLSPLRGDVLLSHERLLLLSGHPRELLRSHERLLLRR